MNKVKLTHIEIKEQSQWNTELEEYRNKNMKIALKIK